jgi:hypothetical protein
MKPGVLRGMDRKRPRGSERSKPCHELAIDPTFAATLYLGRLTKRSPVSKKRPALHDASQLTYACLYCTGDNETHFADITIQLSKRNFASACSSKSTSDVGWRDEAVTCWRHALAGRRGAVQGHVTVVGDEPGFLLFCSMKILASRDAAVADVAS